MVHAAGFNQGIGASAAGLPEYNAGAPNWLVSDDAGFGHRPDHPLRRRLDAQRA